MYLYINGDKLSNYIIFSRALGLTLTKMFGSCYSVDVKKVPLLGQVKYAQASLVMHPTKRMKLNILVVYIPTSYVMLLSRIFFKDMGGEIKMDWSHAIVLVGNKKIKLEPKKKEKFIVLKFEDPKA